MVQLGVVHPIINNGKLISIKFTDIDKDISLNFYDSYQILLSSLDNLSKSFNTSEYHKGKLDHNYISEFINKYGINNITKFKQEATLYCNQDCISLYHVIKKFRSLIFDLFKVDIINYPTITALTFAIYRTHYLQEKLIPILTGQIFNDIKMSYTGGAVDMYIPSNFSLPNGKQENDLADYFIDTENNKISKIEAYNSINKLFSYDVNSLYPYIMANNPMPCGNIYYF